MPSFAQILLPLPFNVTFTYSIPPEMAISLGTGFRVIVPFGARKYYTGIITGFTDKAPDGFEVKEIAAVLDTSPILRRPQIQFWQWIAEYYLAPLGDVYKAAVPSGLKIESETVLTPSPDAEPQEIASLSEREMHILGAMKLHKAMSVSEIVKLTGFHNVEKAISRMVDKGILIVNEKLVERYRSKTETFLRIPEAYTGAEGTREAFRIIGSARKQQMVFMTLIEMLRFSRPGEAPSEVTRKALMDRCATTSTIIKALCDKGIVETYTRTIGRFTPVEAPTHDMPVLSHEQETALKSIHQSLIDHDITLLHGVTSSGKTEVYIHLIDYVLRQGRQVLYLVPEIALTTQLTRRLQRVFGSKVVIYHSKFSDNDRVDVWRHMLDNPGPCVVIGARSSIFLPFADLGLAIVDEEHESSYKQSDPAPRYNARDAAAMLARMHGAKTVLGSATPAIETYYKALEGRFGLVTLSKRFGQKTTLPDISVIDMKAERSKHLVDGAFSTEVISKTRNAITDGRQAIFFHNRRGFAPIARCKACAYIPKCSDCDVALTYHRDSSRLVCHYCGASYPLPSICPVCNEPQIEVIGYGTERVEDEIAAHFADCRILRMDLDTTRARDSYQAIIDDFSAHKADILVGTQMVTKGLDFSDVSTVAVLNADSIINFPDFRSAERAFNMLMQVAGRAGRRDTKGSVLIQTYQPEHPVINYIADHDYEGFYRHEIEERRLFNYPPFTRIIYIYLRHKDRQRLEHVAERYAATLRNLFGTRICGPEEPPVARIQQLYIRKIMLKIEISAPMNRVKRTLLDAHATIAKDIDFKGTLLHYDVDPY